MNNDGEIDTENNIDGYCDRDLYGSAYFLKTIESQWIIITLVGIAYINIHEVYATMAESIHLNSSSLSRDFLKASRRLLRT